MKRKASVLDDAHIGHNWSVFDCSASTSTSSPESVKAFTEHDRTHAHWSVGRVPYLNSRTLKRYRDDRPNEEVIHQNTLAKLFNAQKQIRTEERKQDWQMSSPAISPLTKWPPTSMSNSSASVYQPQFVQFNQPTQPERDQKSLDSFFGGTSRRQTPNNQASTDIFHFPTQRENASVALRCEDCSTPLHFASENPSIFGMDTTYMDVDLQQDEWACASCSRRVCDTCAVRGDHRICLECAVPGGG